MTYAIAYQNVDTLTYLRTSTDLGSLILGIFFGIQIIMAFYNLLLYFSLKDKAYFLYFGTALFGTITVMCIQRLGDQFIWVNTNTDEYLYMTFSGINMFFSSRFAASFLNLKELNKRLNYVMWSIAILSLIWSFSSLAFSTEQVIPFGRWLVLLSFPTYITVAFISYKRGFKAAKYYLIAWIPYALGLIIAAFTGAGWLPANNFTLFALHMGGALELVLLSFALAYRIKGMRLEIAEKELEKEQFKTQLLEDQKIVLEKQVKERTKELSVANATKDKFFSIIAHDLRSPMIGLQGVGKKLEYFIKKNRQEKLLEMGGQIDKSIDQLNHLLNNLLNWAATQTGGIPNHPEKHNVASIVLENVGLYSSLAKSKEVVIKNEIKDGEVFADMNAVSTIIRNLLSNAIKFTKSNSTVTLSKTEDTNTIAITISDEGKGMSQGKANLLFSNSDFKSASGTKGEKGFGLGLQLCKEFTELNNGTIHVTSELDKGTSFTIRLPKHENL